MKKMARKYDKRVAIATLTQTSDGFGGIIESGLSVNEVRWCYVEQPKPPVQSQYRNQFGLKGDARVLRFFFRHFDFDIKNQLLEYDNGPWTPLAVEDTDQYKVETCIVAQALVDNL